MIRRMLAVVCRIAIVSLVAISVFAACGSQEELLLGATTSVHDSGLLDELVAAFEDESDLNVKPIALGSGQLMAMARRGELDVIMAHSPEDEEALIADGLAVERIPVMRNHFLVAGPASDPAGVAGARDLGDAFARIADAEAGFVSRGDESGTHRRELAVWAELGVDPAGESWYRVSAVGQGQSLLVANDGADYTLVDSATLVAFSKRLQIVEIYRDTVGPNVYSVLRLDADRLAHVNEDAADAWIEFMASDRAQRVILESGREEYGVSLFEPLLLE
jgi:tungstate transport system substrate-binding protein